MYFLVIPLTTISMGAIEDKYNTHSQTIKIQ